MNSDVDDCVESDERILNVDVRVCQKAISDTLQPFLPAASRESM
jgi:hypothetical protein